MRVPLRNSHCNVPELESRMYIFLLNCYPYRLFHTKPGTWRGYTESGTDCAGRLPPPASSECRFLPASFGLTKQHYGHWLCATRFLSPHCVGACLTLELKRGEVEREGNKKTCFIRLRNCGVARLFIFSLPLLFAKF